MQLTKSKTPATKSNKISRIYDDIVIDAVKCFTFTAKKTYGTCSLTGKSISKGDKCEMLILEDGTRVTTLLSTTIAKGNKAKSIGKKTQPVAKATKPARKVAKATKPKTTAKAVTKSPAYSEAVVKALAELAKAKDAVAKYEVFISLPSEVMTIVASLTK
jgi:hypothetical protein